MINHDGADLRALHIGGTGTISTSCVPRLTVHRAARRIAPQPVGVDA